MFGARGAAVTDDRGDEAAFRVAEGLGRERAAVAEAARGAIFATQARIDRNSEAPRGFDFECGVVHAGAMVGGDGFDGLRREDAGGAAFATEEEGFVEA